jgi:TATA-box binding protein (TBP) (component of TFIID and TFIIIB)
LINVTFTACESAIRREVLYDILRSAHVGKGKALHDCAFDPTHHPAVKMHYDDPVGQVYVGVFQSGKATINGAISFDQIDRAHAFIRGLVRDYREVISKSASFSISD